MKKLILIDGNSIIFRAFYATYDGDVRNIMKTSKGVYTNALYAFINIFNKIKEQEHSHILVAFDTNKPTLRHEMFQDYKKGRKEAPAELISQFELVYNYLDTIGCSYYKKAGFEADDIIGTLAKKAIDFESVNIYSSDRDLIQLIDDKIKVYLLKSGMKEVLVFDRKKIKEKYQLDVEQLIDLKALMGDKSDNIPGVFGIGEKTATNLLIEYNNLDNIYNNIENLKAGVKNKLLTNKENAYLSKELGTINTNSDIDTDFNKIIKRDIDNNKLINFYKEYELFSFLKQLEKTLLTEKDIPTNLLNSQVKNEENDLNIIYIKEENDIKKLLDKNIQLSFYFEFLDQNYHNVNNELLKICIYDGKHSYILEKDLFLKSKLLINYLKKNNNQITYNLKQVITYFKYLNIFDLYFENDILLKVYLDNQEYGKADLEKLSVYYNLYITIYDLKYSIKNNILDQNISNKAKLLYLLNPILDKNLKDSNQEHLYKDIELKLSYCLSDMEFNGVLIDKDFLINLKEKYETEINDLELKIKQIANKDFNIQSTKQLADVLFNDLKLEVIKKTKTGFSTDQEVLEKLKDKHEIIKYIIEHRQLIKLYSTYVVGLLNSISTDNKIHTIYTQAITQTGRLSSIEPNLQNIPETERARLIKKAFITDEDKILLSMDYSQIELRVLAEISKDENMLNAFKNDFDIHNNTAINIFKTNDITPDLRRKAKAINFGIIYGMSAWSLANDLGISNEEAKDYINNYFKAYPKYLEYEKNILDFCKENGFVNTLYNRKRYIKEISSSNKVLENLGKRLALNSPIQGTAADILKIAMVNIYNYLKDNNLKSKLILQVHDELIFEIYNEEFEILKDKLEELMLDIKGLSVNLKVDKKFGKRWYDL